jgi:prepilin-type N-terminal cleavage/methylation domain-containing protein
MKLMMRSKSGGAPRCLRTMAHGLLNYGPVGSKLKKAKHGGFTLIEMMVVVVILALLGVLAINIYKRYVLKSKASEAMTMLGHIKAKQEAYQAEHYRYAHIPTFHPTAIQRDKKVPFTPLPASGEWQQLGIQATMKATFFQYNTTSDQGNPVANRPPAEVGIPDGQTWFVATAVGQFDSDSTPDTTYEIVSNRDTVWKVDRFGNRAK